MDHRTGTHVVIGAGNIGLALVSYLSAEGCKTQLISRSQPYFLPNGVEFIRTDALKETELARSLTNGDYVYHTIGVPYDKWVDDYPRIMTNILSVLQKKETPTTFVYADNFYMHGEEGSTLGPMNEDTPHLAKGKKGLLRSKLAQQALQAHDPDYLNVTIGRGSDFFGPGGLNSILHYFLFENLVAGKTLRFPGNMEVKHSFIYLKDFAKGLATIGTDPSAYGKVWALPHISGLTSGAFFAEALELFGRDRSERVRGIPKFILHLAGLFDKQVREVKEVLYQTQHDWVVDDSRFASTFGWEATPFKNAMVETVEWYKRDYVFST